MTSVIILVTVLVDLVTKHIAKNNLPVIKNNNLAFGITASNTISISITAAILAVLFFYFFKSKNSLTKIQKVGFSLIFGGAISNLLERIWLGYVTDFIFLSNGVLNLADVFIFLGIIVLLITIVKPKMKVDSSFRN